MFDNISSTAHSTVNIGHPITIECIYLDLDHILCNGTEYEQLEEKLSPSDSLFWIYLGIYIVLVLFAGLMAGLTIAILSLDMTSLKVLEVAGTEENRRCAKRILPMVKRRHLVLVTLVLANAASVEAMPIFMDRISDPVTAVLVSSTAVLIFGEVLPQAICSRYGLKVGYFMAWLVWGLVGIAFVIALPFSYLLDIILGKESGTFYGRKELEALVDIHGPKPKTPELHGRKGFASCGRNVKLCTETLSVDEVLIIKGALTMTHKIASTAMVKLEHVFMLSIDTIFDEHCLKSIFELGHSRIPVYEGDRKNILGVFLTKRLIAIDPNQRITLKHLIDESTAAERKAFYRGLRVNENMHMYELLNRFQTGTLSHMAFVTSKTGDSDTEEITGIVTLEDVIEEEIFDEADVKRETCKCSLPVSIQKVAMSYRKSLVPSKTQADIPTLTNKNRSNRIIMTIPTNRIPKKSVTVMKPNDMGKAGDSVQLDLVDECEECGGHTYVGSDINENQTSFINDNKKDAHVRTEELSGDINENQTSYTNDNKKDAHVRTEELSAIDLNETADNLYGKTNT